MNLQERIDVLVALGKRISDFESEKVKYSINKAYIDNHWFTPENTKKSIIAISENYLSKEKIEHWISTYSLDNITPKQIALILAGNIPLVGIHDVLSTFITGHYCIIKPATKDKALLELIINQLVDINPECSKYFEIVERLSTYDAVICTGSNTTASHFEYYFRDYPKIIRKNRASIAVLNGDESPEELKLLGKDVFSYFGLGCRNVSKLYIPQDFNTNRIFEAFINFSEIQHHNKYKNNYDYNEAIWLMGQDAFLTNGFIILKEEKSIHSRIGSLHYERYPNLKSLVLELQAKKEELQCISTNINLTDVTTLPIGHCQSPSLSDYADGIDTLEFLIKL